MPHSTVQSENGYCRVESNFLDAFRRGRHILRVVSLRRGSRLGPPHRFPLASLHVAAHLTQQAAGATINKEIACLSSILGEYGLWEMMSYLNIVNALIS
jgi:hypothetical protein